VIGLSVIIADEASSSSIGLGFSLGRKVSCDMPNWTEQTLHVVGAKADIDRFVRTGFIRRKPGEIDDVLDFLRLCPLKRRERKDTYTHPSGVVLMHLRTRTQAAFSITTSWDYPAEFYARLAQHWPTLGFVCAVNGEMGDFGGILMSLGGDSVNHVRDYHADYDRRAHARQIRSLMTRWAAFLSADRPWRLVATAPWEHRDMSFDAHFDDDGSFFFRSREEMSAFRKRYPAARPMRRTADGWTRTR
jgi:hypothetical protein